MKKDIKDPVDEAEEKDEDLFDINNLSIEDLKPIKQKAVRYVSPFDGYPFKDMQFNKHIKIKTSFIVVLKSSEEVFQDPSGKNVSTTDKKGKAKIVNIETFHNRMVVDSQGRNIDVVFDRELKLQNGLKAQCALVPDNTARSQILFYLTRKGKVKADGRYLLIDRKQSSRLRKTFDNFHYQQLKGERDALSHDSDD